MLNPLHLRYYVLTTFPAVQYTLGHSVIVRQTLAIRALGTKNNARFTKPPKWFLSFSFLYFKIINSNLPVAVMGGVAPLIISYSVIDA